MKKSLKILATALCAVIAAAPLALSACGEDETPPAGHTHAYTYTPNGDGTHNGVCANADGKCTEINIANETCADGNSDGECDKCHAAIGSSDEMTEAKWKAAFDAFENADYFQISGNPSFEAKYDKKNRLALNYESGWEEGYVMNCVQMGDKWVHRHVVDDGNGGYEWYCKCNVCSVDTEKEALSKLVRFLTAGQMMLENWWRAEKDSANTCLSNLFSCAVYDNNKDVYTLSLFSDMGVQSGEPMNLTVTVGIENGRVVKFGFAMEGAQGGSILLNITYNTEQLTVPYSGISEEMMYQYVPNGNGTHSVIRDCCGRDNCQCGMKEEIENVPCEDNGGDGFCDKCEAEMVRD